jgi:hypothetical protein
MNLSVGIPAWVNSFRAGMTSDIAVYLVAVIDR